MKKHYLFLMLLFVGFTNCKIEQKEKVLPKGSDATKLEITPKSTFEDLEGNPIELTDFKGKRILLNFWATWCKPCIEEMPALLNAQEALTDENYVFLLASDQSLEKIKKFKDKKNFDFTFIKFNGSLAEMKINALPATFIFNKAGKSVDRIDGATEWDSPEMIDKLKAIE